MVILIIKDKKKDVKPLSVNFVVFFYIAVGLFYGKQQESPIMCSKLNQSHSIFYFFLFGMIK